MINRITWLFITLVFLLLSSSFVYAEYPVEWLPQDKKSLNKKHPKPTLEDGLDGLNYTGSIYAVSCKGSDKNKKTWYLNGYKTFDMYVACRITSPTDYHGHLRKIADKRAAKYCREKYSSIAYFRGLGNVSDADGKFWRLMGDVISLGTYINKRTVAVSYVCGENLNNSSSLNSNSSSQYSNMSNYEICRSATTTKGKWESVDSFYYRYKKEAKHRNLSLNDCNKLTGRGNISSSDFSHMSTKDICYKVTTQDGKWKSIRKPYEEEINKRNITLYKCRNLTGRGSNEITEIDLTSLSNKEICLRSTTKNGNWEPYGGSYGKHRLEADRRNLNLYACNSLTGRKNSSSAEITTILDDLSNFAICKKATTADGLWEPYGGSFDKYRTEARKRGLDLSKCNKLTQSGIYESDSSTEENLNTLFIYISLVILIIVIFIIIRIRKNNLIKAEKVFDKDPSVEFSKTKPKKEINLVKNKFSKSDIKTNIGLKSEKQKNEIKIKSDYKKNTEIKDKIITDDGSENSMEDEKKISKKKKTKNNIITIMDVSEMKTKICNYCETENLGDENVCQICGKPLT